MNNKTTGRRLGAGSERKPILPKMLLVMAVMLLLFWAVIFAVDRIKLSGERDMLDKKGYLNPVSVGDYSLNVCTCGNSGGKHKLVAMSGAGVSNLSVDLRSVTDRFTDDDLIVFVDRAGYGLSDDTKTPQTVDRIVSDYRTALKNAGIEAPYVLLPHSVAGAYASYWVSKYPEEVEGIVFLDSTILGDDIEFEEGVSGFTDGLEIFLCRTGMYRFAAGRYIVPLPEGRSEEDNAVSYALNIRSGWNYAQSSENRLMKQNLNDTWDELETTDVPKVYICSSWGYTSADEVIGNIQWLNAQRVRRGVPRQEIDTDVARAAVSQSEEKREKSLTPYLDRLGSCELELLGGDHFIFDQKPEECAEIIERFLKKLDDR